LDGAIDQSGLNPDSMVFSGLEFAVATRRDEADLRCLLRDNPMGGWVSLSLQREPDYFRAAASEGDTHQTIIVREQDSAAAVAVFSRSVRDAYLNGAVARLGYIGMLRVTPAYRHKIRLLRHGFQALRSLIHDPLETPVYLTSIVEDNHAARRILCAKLSGMPTYREQQRFCTFALIPSRRYRTSARAAAVEPATEFDLAEIAACLQRNYRRYQFAPYWSLQTLRSEQRCPNLAPGDFFVVCKNGRIAGCAALWDQSAFKQSVVHGYKPALARVRPLLNLASPVLRLPRLPPAGAALRQVYLSHLAVDGDDPDTLRALISAVLSEAAARKFPLVTLGVATNTPIYSVIRTAFRAREYLSRLYTVFWDEGRSAADTIDGRVGHVEIATL
jgi:hypothetical protein